MERLITTKTFPCVNHITAWKRFQSFFLFFPLFCTFSQLCVGVFGHFYNYYGCFSQNSFGNISNGFRVFLEVIIGKVSKVFMGTGHFHGDGGFPWGRGLSMGTEALHTRKGTYDNDVPWGTDIEFLLRYENSRFFCDDIWFFGFLREKISKILISIQEILILIAMTA